MASHKKYYSDSDEFGHTPTRMKLASYGRYAYDNPSFATGRKPYPVMRPYGHTGHSSSEYSSEDSLISRKKRNYMFVVGVILLTVLVIVGAMTVGIYFAMNKTRTTMMSELPDSRIQTEAGKKAPDATMTLRARNKQWDTELADTQSKRFAEMAIAFEKEIDDTFKASDMADIYDYSVVTELRAGSVVAVSNVIFKANTVQTTDAQKQKKAKFKEQPETFVTAVKEAFVARAKQRAENNDESGVVIDTATVVAEIVTTTSTTTTTTTTTTPTTTQPTTTEPTTQPTTEPATTQPAATQPTTEPATTQPAATPPTTEPATTQPTTSEPTTTQATVTESTTATVTTEPPTTSGPDTATTATTAETDLSTDETTDTPTATTLVPPSTSETVQTTTTTFATTTTPPPEEEVLPNFDTNLTVTNYTWNDALNDTESPEYKNLSTKVVAQVDEVMKNSNMSEYYNRTEVQSIRQGSVIVIVVIIMNPIPVIELPQEIAEVTEKPEIFVEIFTAGANIVREMQEQNPNLTTDVIAFDVDTIAVVVVRKQTKCEKAVLNSANLCGESFNEFKATLDADGDVCPSYRYFVNCLRFIVQYVKMNKCHVHHVPKAAVFYVRREMPGATLALDSCEDSNGQVGYLVNAPSNTEDICLDANNVKYISKFYCPDEMEQVRTEDYNGNCNVLDTLSSCVHGVISDLASEVGKEVHCRDDDVKQTLMDYKDEIIQSTSLPDICFGIDCPAGQEMVESTGMCQDCAVGYYKDSSMSACQQCPPGHTTANNGTTSMAGCSVLGGSSACVDLSTIQHMSGVYCSGPVAKLSSSSGSLDDKCSAYIDLGRCLVYVLHKEGCDSSSMHSVVKENAEALKPLLGFDPNDCEVPAFSAEGMCTSVEYYNYVYEYHCPLDTSEKQCSAFYKNGYCVLMTATQLGTECNMADYSQFLDANKERYPPEFGPCIDNLHEVVNNTCLDITNLENMGNSTFCLVTMSVGLESSTTCGETELAIYAEGMRCSERRMDNTCTVQEISEAYSNYAPMAAAAMEGTESAAMFESISLCAGTFKDADLTILPEFCNNDEAILQIFINYIKKANMTSYLNMTSRSGLELTGMCNTIMQGFQTTSHFLLDTYLDVKCDNEMLLKMAMNNSDAIKEEIPEIDLSLCEGNQFCKSFFGGSMNPQDMQYGPGYTTEYAYVPSVATCGTFLGILATTGSELPFETMCKLYVEGLRCMEVKGSIYGDTCTKDDFHKDLSRYSTSVNITTFPVHLCPDSIEVMAATQEPMCNNPVLLANLANIACMQYLQAIPPGCGVLDYVVDCLDLTLNTSSIYCCKDRLRYGIVAEADIIKQEYSQHDFSSCETTDMSDTEVTNNGSSGSTSMESCRSSDFFIQSLAQYCSLSVYQLQNNLDGTMACRMFSDTIQCLAIAANYQGYSCTVNDMLMVSRESPSLLGLENFNSTSCETVQPVTQRNPGTSSPCNDDKVKEYLLTYACTQFSGQNLAMVREDNFCRKARETNHCLQKWLAGYGTLCSLKETSQMMHRIPKTEYLGCFDGCGLTYYKGTCDDRFALIEELGVCKDNITAMVGVSEYYQCSKYWPDVVKCIQDVLYDGGAVCDGVNIALKLRTYSTPVLNAWGVNSADNCLKDFDYNPACHARGLISKALDECYDTEECGQVDLEAMKTCVRNELNHKPEGQMCSMNVLDPIIRDLLTERGYQFSCGDAVASSCHNFATIEYMSTTYCTGPMAKLNRTSDSTATRCIAYVDLGKCLVYAFHQDGCTSSTMHSVSTQNHGAMQQFFPGFDPRDCNVPAISAEGMCSSDDFYVYLQEYHCPVSNFPPSDDQCSSFNQHTLCMSQASVQLSGSYCKQDDYTIFLNEKRGMFPEYGTCIDNIMAVMNDSCFPITSPSFGMLALCLATVSLGLGASDTCQVMELGLYAEGMKCMQRRMNNSCTQKQISGALQNYTSLVGQGTPNILGFQALSLCADAFDSANLTALLDTCVNEGAIVQMFISYMNLTNAASMVNSSDVYSTCYHFRTVFETIMEISLNNYLGLDCDQDDLWQMVIDNSDAVKEQIPQLDLSNCGEVKFCSTLFGRGTDPDANHDYGYGATSNYNYDSSYNYGSNYAYGTTSNYNYGSTSKTTMTHNNGSASSSNHGKTYNHVSTSSPNYNSMAGQTMSHDYSTYSPGYSETVTSGPMVAYVPSVLKCTTFMTPLLTYSDAPLDIKCRLYVEGLRCMEVKGSIYGDTCTKDDFHLALSGYASTMGYPVFPINICSGTIESLASQQPLCNNTQLLAIIANLACISHYSPGCSNLDGVVGCLDETLKASTTYCCKDGLRNALISGADFIKEKFPDHDYSDCDDTESSEGAGQMDNGEAMMPCPTSDNTLHAMKRFCQSSMHHLKGQTDDELGCRIYSDTIKCLAIASNYNGYGCDVDDILTIDSNNASVFGIQYFNPGSCGAVDPINMRYPGTSRPCNDDFMHYYLLNYVCMQFSGENLAWVTDTNFCRTAKYTRQCLQNTYADFGLFCSLKETANMLNGIPRTEYLGCVDDCKELNYMASCDEGSAPIEELGFCYSNITAMIGKPQDDQCNVYWPSVIECVQEILYRGGAICDGDNIARRIRQHGTNLLQSWGVTTTEICLDGRSFTKACEARVLVSKALTACYSAGSKCGKQELDNAKMCVQKEFSSKMWSKHCEMDVLEPNVLQLMRLDGYQSTCSDGQLRLKDNNVVEILENGLWGTVCAGPNWDDSAASVVCRELDYTYGFASHGYRNYDVPVHIHNVSCNGYEEKLLDCDIDDNSTSYCSDGAAASCMNELTNVTISGGGRSGWVIGERGGVRAQICDSNGWYNDDAVVVCMSRGYAGGETYEQAEKPLPLSSAFKARIDCKGVEKSIDACVRNSWHNEPVDISGLNSDNYYYGECSMWSMARVYCYDSVRLHRKYGNSTGIVLIVKGRESKLVCSDGFNDNAASVVCRKLGFATGGSALDFNPFQNYNYYGYWVTNVACTGSENSLWDCDHTERPYSNCPSNTPAVVKCNTDEPEVPDWQVKVESDGRVLVSRFGIFGTICSNGWSESEATLICKTQGYDSAYTRKLYHGSAQVPFWLHDVSCEVSAETLQNCSFNASSSRYCNEDAGVYCFNMTDVPKYSMDKGTHDNYGYLYAERDGTTAVVCGNYWTSDNSEVACRSMGYEGGETYWGDLGDTGGTTAWYGNYLNCKGDENILDMCSDTKWELQNLEGEMKSYTPCLNNLAKVFCYGKVKLHTGFFNNSGTVEVYVSDEENGQYKGICATDFTNDDATVVCKQLNLSQSGIALPPSTYNVYSYGYARINVSCNGMESSIFDCTVPHGNMQWCSSGRATVLCNDTASIDDAITDVQWKDSNGNDFSPVFVKRYGIWGTICYHGWSKENADVVCKAEDYDGGFPKRIYSSEREERWIGSINCTGTETSLLECDYTTEISGRCRYSSEVASVYCYKESDLAKFTFVPRTGMENTGWVTVTRHGETYPLCTWLGYDESMALCRHFGFDGGYQLSGQTTDIDYSHFWNVYFNCGNGYENPNTCGTQWEKGPSIMQSTCYYQTNQLQCYGDRVTASEDKCQDVSLYQKYASECEGEVQSMQNDPNCNQLLNVSRCLRDAMCQNGTHCTVGQIMMGFRYSNMTEELLGLENARDACDGLSLTVNICEDEPAVNCAFTECIPLSEMEFMYLNFSSKCRKWQDMIDCTMSTLTNSQHSCSRNDVSKVVDKFAREMNFAVKECPNDEKTTSTPETEPEAVTDHVYPEGTPEGVTSSEDKCQDVSLYQKYASECEGEVQSMQDDPNCNRLLNVSRCLRDAMCQNGTHCTVGQIMMGFRYSNMTEELLGLENARDACDGLSLTVNICEDEPAVSCAFTECIPLTEMEFMDLSFSSKCRKWQDMIDCTMSTLTNSQQSCSRNDVENVVDKFAREMNFAVKECPNDEQTTSIPESEPEATTVHEYP